MTEEAKKRILEDLGDGGISLPPVPSRKNVIELIKTLQTLMFPRYFHPARAMTPGEAFDTAHRLMRRETAAAVGFCASVGCGDGETCGGDTATICHKETDTEKVCDRILSAIPEIRDILFLDAEAIYEGDPAARSVGEVILSYPGFYAISIYRIAHLFYMLGVPYIPRLMTEYAHEKTGIDIHAGAKIGKHFFIDHGTGIVIGETTTIGEHVKLYQGVTLGAKSFELDKNGNPVKGIKRHPDIGNNVIIYANATILGGNTKIGDGCVIGGNVWLTHSVEPGSVVYYDGGTKR